MNIITVVKFLANIFWSYLHFKATYSKLKKLTVALGKVNCLTQIV